MIDLLGILTRKELLGLTDNPGKVKKFAAELAQKAVENNYFEPLSDEQAIELLCPKKEGCEEDDEWPKKRKQTEHTVAQWRKLAAELGYTGPVAWKVRAGFTLKKHAPKAGPCHNDFKYLQDWEFANDEPTKQRLVFWIPRLVKDSTRKNIRKQKQLSDELRTRFELPEHHLSSYGSATLLSGLILRYFKQTGERVPLKIMAVRTDTRRMGGSRLILFGFGSDSLNCDNWNWIGGGCNDVLGFFPLGVEELGS